MRNTVYWVEIPATDFARARKFYETVFNVELILVPTMPRGKYAIFPVNIESQGAGIAVIEGEGYKAVDKGAIVYLDRNEDLSIPLSRVENAGGKIILPKSKN